ncbi:GspE/PulE family protein [Desulfobacula sp.]|uniref:GspE/PulE family protein n=1 Tax=Desulfobacula sp. TaxID=2593537 RepID=UPI0039B94363
MSHISLRKGMVDPAIVDILPKEKAIQMNVIPMFRVNNVLTVATSDPHDFFKQDKIAEITKFHIQQVSCTRSDINKAIEECYQGQISIDDVISSVDEGDLSFVEESSEATVSEIAKMAEGSPVVNLTNLILLKAIRKESSDIHIEPQQDNFMVRARVDGILYELMTHGMERHSAVVSRLKVMANLDISERRMPQDGRIQVTVDGRLIDLRFSSLPGYYGEKVVLRILDRSKSVLDINRLGFAPPLLTLFKELLRRPYGLIIVCGPTGSGKTTTLYAAVNLLNTIEKNIVAIEDPVEYQIHGITQVPVKAAIGLTFARILRHVLRQDPDIVLVGEIRDRETAKIAIEASLTGRLVLSTLHTNDSPSTITRLLEMGIEPYLISSSLLASIGQRLARAICPNCQTDFYPPKQVIKELGFDKEKNLKLIHGRGCTSCFDSGFKGRLGIHEMLVNEPGLQKLILNNPTIDKLKEYLEKKDFKTMQQDGYKKVLEGLTTIEEVQMLTVGEE